MESAMSSDLTSSVVGIPCRAHTDAKANPKFPPPMTAIRTGYGGAAFMDSDVDVLCRIAVLCRVLIGDVVSDVDAFPSRREF